MTGYSALIESLYGRISYKTEIKDKVERKISKITKNLNTQSLFRAVSAKRSEPGLIHHVRPGKPVLLP